MISRTPIEPPLRLVAEVFHRKMGTGRNRALLIGGRAPDETTVECVVKLPGLSENPALHPLPSLLEWMGSVLARELGVTTPVPYEVIVSREFVDVMRDPAIHARAASSLGSVFGSGFVSGMPMIAGDLLDTSLRPAAAHLVAFDAFIHNVDRRADNPNLFLLRRGPIAFDHAEAFAFLFQIGGRDPITDPLLDLLDEHALAAHVRRRSPIILQEFRELLAALDDACLAEIAGATPRSWQTGLAAGKMTVLLDILRRRRDAAHEWLPKVEAWMQR